MDALLRSQRAPERAALINLYIFITMSYSIIIWDNDRAEHKVWFPKTLSVVGEAIDHLAKETPGPNVRFERLAQHLLKHFPLPPKEPGPNASQEERDA